MAADTAPQGNVVQDRPVAPQAHDAVQDFTPASTKSTTWSDVANQCWNGDFKSCASSFGQAFKDTFHLGGTQDAGKTLEDQMILPQTRITDTGAVVPSDSAEALPKAMQADNKQRTETVLNAKADPQDRLKAANELINAGVTGFTVQSPDGNLNNVRLEKEKAGNSNLLGIYVSNQNGAEINALRGVRKADGTIEQQRDGSGKFVDYKGRGAALLDRVSEGGKVVEAADKVKEPGARVKEADRREVDKGTEPAEKKSHRNVEPEAAADKKKIERETPADKKKIEPKRPGEATDGQRQGDPPKEGEFKSPYERKYSEGDKFKGIASVYWEDSQTASGLRFNKNEHTAASREFPFGTVLKVRNPENGQETRVVVTDNGPFEGRKVERPDGSEKVHNRVLDISDGAQKAIGMGREVKALEVTVESIPENGAWGRDRRNLSKAGRQELLATVKRVSDGG